MAEPDPDEDSIREYQASVRRAQAMRIIGVLIVLGVGGMLLGLVCLGSLEDGLNGFIMRNTN